MESYHQILTQLVALAPRLKGSEARLLNFLVHVALLSSSTDVELSVLAVMAGARLSRWSVHHSQASLEAAGIIVRVPGRHHNRNRYRLAFLGGIQIPLFTPDNWSGKQTAHGLENRPVGAETGPPPVWKPDHHQSGNQTTEGPENRPVGAETGPPNGGKPHSAVRKPDHQEGFPQQDVDIPRARRSIESEVSIGSSSSSIDRVLRKTTITEDDRPAAKLLTSAMLSFAAKHAAPGMSPPIPDDTILAQCLAIRPAVECRDALLLLADNLRGRQITRWSWFVTAFLAHFEGVAAEDVKRRRHALRLQRSPDAPTHNPEYRDSIIDGLNRSVKTLR